MSDRWDAFCDALRELAVLEFGACQGVLAAGFPCTGCGGRVPSGIPEGFRGSRFVICETCVGIKDALRKVRERVEHRRGVPDVDLAKQGWALVRARIRGEQVPTQASLVLDAQATGDRAGGLRAGGGPAPVHVGERVGAAGSPPGRVRVPRNDDGAQGSEPSHPVPIELPFPPGEQEPTDR